MTIQAILPVLLFDWLHCDESKDSCIDFLVDLDCDGICDPGNSEPNCTGTDNCPTFSNPLQHDSSLLVEMDVVMLVNAKAISILM